MCGNPHSFVIYFTSHCKKINGWVDSVWHVRCQTLFGRNSRKDQTLQKLPSVSDLNCQLLQRPLRSRYITRKFNGFRNFGISINSNKNFFVIFCLNALRQCVLRNCVCGRRIPPDLSRDLREKRLCVERKKRKKQECERTFRAWRLT